MITDAIIGTCTWDACKQCKHYMENGCDYGEESHHSQMEVEHGIVYCMLYEEKEE